jgi:hypothetical protein
MGPAEGQRRVAGDGGGGLLGGGLLGGGEVRDVE